MNPDLARLQAYPFERIRTLLQGISPADLPAVSLAMGEPKHPTPAFIHEAIAANWSGLANYPLTKGTAVLRETIADWLMRRFQLPAGSVDAEQHVIPVNGTREALFAFAQTVVERTADAAIVMPNPFYQIYEGAALLAGAEPVFLNCTADNGFIPDFAAVPAATWQRCQLLYICSPGNPTGAVMPLETLQQVLKLAEAARFYCGFGRMLFRTLCRRRQPATGFIASGCRDGEYRVETLCGIS